MLHYPAAIRLDRAYRAQASGDDLRAKMLFGVVQIALAVIFIPPTIAILVVVGFYVGLEWGYLRGYAALRSRVRPLAAKPHRRGRHPLMRAIRPHA